MSTPVSAPTNLPDNKAGGVITIPWGPGMRAGSGYDYVARTSKGVAPGKSTFKDQNLGNEFVDVSITRVENVEELQDYLRVEAGVSGAYKMFGGSASADFVRNVNINRYSIYFLVRAVAICKAEQATPLKLSDKVANLNAEKFRLKFGDHFVSARKKGSVFFALLEMKTDSEETRMAVVASLKASFGDKKTSKLASIKGNFSSAVMKAASHQGVSLSMRIIAEGVGPNFLKLTQNFKPKIEEQSDSD
jgi:hypothetical protein